MHCMTVMHNICWLITTHAGDVGQRTLSCCTVEPFTTARQTAPSFVGSQVRSRGLTVVWTKKQMYYILAW